MSASAVLAFIAVLASVVLLIVFTIATNAKASHVARLRRNDQKRLRARLRHLAASVSRFRTDVATGFAKSNVALSGLSASLVAQTELVLASVGQNKEALEKLGDLLEKNAAALSVMERNSASMHSEVTGLLKQDGLDGVIQSLVSSIEAFTQRPTPTADSITAAFQARGVLLSPEDAASIVAWVTNAMAVGLTLERALYEVLPNLPQVKTTFVGRGSDVLGAVSQATDAVKQMDADFKTQAQEASAQLAQLQAAAALDAQHHQDQVVALQAVADNEQAHFSATKAAIEAVHATQLRDEAVAQQRVDAEAAANEAMELALFDLQSQVAEIKATLGGVQSQVTEVS